MCRLKGGGKLVITYSKKQKSFVERSRIYYLWTGFCRLQSIMRQGFISKFYHKKEIKGKQKVVCTKAKHNHREITEYPQQKAEKYFMIAQFTGFIQINYKINSKKEKSLI